MSHYEIFEHATKAVERSWIRGNLFDAHGGVCLVGGLMEAQNVDRPSAINQAVIRAVDARLRKRHFAYRIIAHNDDLRGDRGHFDTIARIEAWNDMPWRRKKTVVRILRKLADSQRTQWLEDERSRLVIKVTKLESLVAVLQERVERLERENIHLWDRLLNTRQLHTDLESLQSLEAELAETQHQLETVG